MKVADPHIRVYVREYQERCFNVYRKTSMPGYNAVPVEYMNLCEVVNLDEYQYMEFLNWVLVPLQVFKVDNAYEITAIIHYLNYDDEHNAFIEITDDNIKTLTMSKEGFVTLINDSDEEDWFDKDLYRETITVNILACHNVIYSAYCPPCIGRWYNVPSNEPKNIKQYWENWTNDITYVVKQFGLERRDITDFSLDVNSKISFSYLGHRYEVVGGKMIEI